MSPEIYNLGLVFLTGFLITYIAIPSILEVAYKKNLFDAPNNRKVHKREIPSLGGVGIFMGVLITFTIWASEAMYTSPYYKYILTCYLILFFMGLKDDLIVMPTKQKFAVQLFVISLLVFGGIRIVNLHGVFGIHELPYWFSFALSVFFILGVTNAFNLIDGIDGLAGGLGGINCLTFGALMYIFEEYDFANLAFAVGGALLAFLRYNFSSYPTKIFMGDTGSLLLGLTVSILAIVFMNVEESTVASTLDFLSPPLVVLGIMFIPIFDTLRVMLVRVLDGKSPFSPDKNHIHHEFLASGATHKMASVSLYLINILLVLVVMIFRSQGSLLLGVIILFVGSASTQVLIFLRYKNRGKKVNDLNQKLEQLKRENQFM